MRLHSSRKSLKSTMSPMRRPNTPSNSLLKNTINKMARPPYGRPGPGGRNLTCARCLDAVMKVTLAILQRVYEIMQGHTEQNSQGEEDALEPDSHLFFIDAFDMPLWHWSPERSTFERYGHTRSYGLAALTKPRAAHNSTVSGSGDSRVSAVRDRLGIIRQTVMRNEHFSPSTLPSRDREHLLTASCIHFVDSSSV